ncbi:unnamed protein product [Candidula unifasciata]|uniref:Zinc transporter ZIP14 n=1 Tax=Candidula unifasciata TaxID=100452 RepID=A0A8S3YU52_9EUPU|nr:unnamed protein product [Candidula unifasciata]
MSQTIKILVLPVLLVLVSKFVKTGNAETLEDIFGSAIARTAKSFTSLASRLKSEGVTNTSAWNSSCLESENNATSFSKCLQESAGSCLSLQDISRLYNITPSQNLSKEAVASLSLALIYSILSCESQRERNSNDSEKETEKSAPPSSYASWGYTFLFVTLINLCSLTGAVVLPCMKLKSYKLVLMFMVALAVGTLAGSGLLFLIPEAFRLVHDEDSGYIWKATSIMGGIYLFYLTEKIMRMINSRRENTSLKKQRDEMATKDTITTSFRRVPLDNSLPGKDASQIAESIGGICSSQLRSHSSFNSSVSEIAHPLSFKTDEEDVGDTELTISTLDNCVWEKSPCNGNGHSHNHYHLDSSSEIAPVAYMIIFGDALHNFIDGLSIGSAFTQSIMTGVSVSVAVMCEELPHELGDFAILLNSGMRFRKALMYNFLSACTCYIGSFIGIILAENTASHEWIFAIAGGMFLYISLVDMMPEMNTAAESKEGKQFGEMKTFLLQNCGLATGYSIMLIFALYGGNISFG